MSGNDKTLKVNYLARVEGEGGIRVVIKDGRVTEVMLNIFEPPRFFEAFLRGRRYSEAPDITARICGICPVAYQMSSIHAMEQACGVVIDGPLRELRRLLYCGEWIESHALHVYLLHAPDFLGYEDALQLAKDMPDVVADALKLKKIGNDIVALLGGHAREQPRLVGQPLQGLRRRRYRRLLERHERARRVSLGKNNASRRGAPH